MSKRQRLIQHYIRKGLKGIAKIYVETEYSKGYLMLQREIYLNQLQKAEWEIARLQEELWKKDRMIMRKLLLKDTRLMKRLLNQ